MLQGISMASRCYAWFSRASSSPFCMRKSGSNVDADNDGAGYGFASVSAIGCGMRKPSGTPDVYNGMSGRGSVSAAYTSSVSVKDDGQRYTHV